MKPKHAPAPVLIDEVQDEVQQEPPSRSDAGRREWTRTGLELLATPLRCITSARRNVVSAPCVVEGSTKLWIHLDLRLPLQTLVDGAGNGRLSGLKCALRVEIARSINVTASQVDVKEILDRGDTTKVNLVVSESLPGDGLCRAASDLMDQVERNKRADTDSADLLELITHVEVKSHGGNQMLWSFRNCLAILITIVALSHEACGAPMLRSLSMRASNLGSQLWAGQHKKHIHQERLALRTPSMCRPSVKDRKRMTALIDLDHTSIYGNDGNDLGVALQWMGKQRSTLEELYRKIVNPSLRSMYESYRTRGKVIDLVIYTRRPDILYRRSEFYGRRMEMQYASHFHADEQLYIPSSVASTSDIWSTYQGPYLPDREAFDAECALERLLAARDAIARELGLDVPPPVVVTAQGKDVAVTARHLRIPVDSALLFDDNVLLKDNSRVVLVDKMTALPREKGAEVLAFMQREAPVEDLKPDLVEFLLEAPAGGRSLLRAGSRLTWHVPLASTALPWQTPDPLIYPGQDGNDAAAVAADLLEKGVAAGEGSLEREQQISECSDTPL